MATPAEVNLGIDVAKAQLDVAVYPTGETWQVPRSRPGLRRSPTGRGGQREREETVGRRRGQGAIKVTHRHALLRLAQFTSGCV